MATTTVKPAAEELDNHKCLVYWHNRNMHTIPVRYKDKKDRIVLFPGWNTVDSVYIESIFQNCEDIIESGRLELKGIVYKDGKVIESFSLAKCSAKEFAKILSATYNPATLEDLQDPNIVSALLTPHATTRKRKLDEAVGNEADNIDVRGEEKHGL